MRSTIWALVAALLVVAGPAFAGGGAKGDVEVGVYGGYGWLDDYGGLFPKDGPLYGARLGYFLSRHWSIEASAQRLSTESEFDTVGVPNVDLHFDAIRGNVLYNFRADEKFRPFVTGGLGYERLEVVDGESSGNLGWNAGAGFRWFFTPRVNLRAEGRYVGSKPDELDELQNNIEATAGLSLLFGGGATEAAAVETPPRANQPPTVTCAGDRSELLPGESVNLRATASDPENDPLTYEWSTTAGRVTGSGATATFDFTGATAPSTATVTVRVSDGHGNNASSDCAMTLKEAVKQAEAVSCLAGGFPRNLSRLTNVDKACLDDVAQRLQADPRATVTVIGHADSRETSAERVGEQRATAVRTYLVQERSIEASRITVRSAAATKPLDTGTDAGALARNRRVEVWFVPEGATIPSQP